MRYLWLILLLLLPTYAEAYSPPPNCPTTSGTKALNYSTATNAYSCNSVAIGSASGLSGSIQYNNSGILDGFGLWNGQNITLTNSSTYQSQFGESPDYGGYNILDLSNNNAYGGSSPTILATDPFSDPNVYFTAGGGVTTGTFNFGITSVASSDFIIDSGGLHSNNAVSFASGAFSSDNVGNVYASSGYTTGTYHYSQNTYITFPTVNSRVMTDNETTGYTFQVSLPITVTQIGRLYTSGNVQNHIAYIWNNNNTSTPIASGTILASSGSSSGYKYVSITPVTLYPGQQYTVGIDEYNGGDNSGNQGDYVASPGINVSPLFGSIRGAYTNSTPPGTFPSSFYGVNNYPFDAAAFIFSYVDTQALPTGFTTVGVVSGASVIIPPTDSSGNGVLYQGGSRFLSSFGQYNAFIGPGSGNFSLTGQYNLGIGNNVLANLTTGTGDICIGAGVCASTTTGGANVIIGVGNGNAVISNSGNVSIGNASFYQSHGDDNVFIGNIAGFGATGSDIFTNSVYVGAVSGAAVYGFGVSGLSYAGGFGYAAYTAQSHSAAWGAPNSSGYQMDLFIGTTTSIARVDDEIDSTTKVGMIVNGTSSQSADLERWNVNGTNLAKVDASGMGTFKGVNIGSTNVYKIDGQTGLAFPVDSAGAYGSVAVGAGSLAAQIAGGGGNDNVAVGYYALNLTTGNQNVAIGYHVLPVATTGNTNVGIGHAALESCTTCGGNIAIGHDALANNLTGIFNFAIGNLAQNQATGSYNTASGANALYSVTGQHTLAFGFNSAFTLGSGSYNVCLGDEACNDNNSKGFTDTGSYNVAIGYDALGNHSSNHIISGNGNIAIGRDTSNQITSGANNTVIGYQAGMSITTGSNDILIGQSIDALSASASNEINIGGLLFYNNTSTAAPAVSACGTSPSIDSNANNRSGTVTVGSIAAASCTITFAGGGYSNWNHCRVTSQGIVTSFAYTYSLTVITITGTNLIGDKVDYDCDGY